jgi:hypothetical protein
VRALLIGAALGSIIAMAAVLRFLALDENPGGLYVDEAAEALSAQRLLQLSGMPPVFFADGGGREALFAYLVAFGFRLFGESVLVLRSVAAAIGVGAVAAVWLLGRRFGAVPALAGAAWAAGSLWLVCVSRDGMRNTLVPLLGALALASLLAWERRPGRGTALLAGGVTSLAALYTYQPLKLLPMLVLVWLWWMQRTNREAYQALRPTFTFLVVSFLAVGAPMIAVAITDPNAWFGRAAGVSLFTDTLAGLPAHWLRTLGMFFVAGDPNARHTVGALPLLGWPMATLAGVGMARLWHRRRDPSHALLLWSLPVFLLPPMLATEGDAPHFLRALGLAAPLAVTIGIGIATLAEFAVDRWGVAGGRAALVVAAAGLIALAVGSGGAYQSRPLANRYDAFSHALVALAEAAGPEDVAIVDDYSAGVVRFLKGAEAPSIVSPGSELRSQVPGASVLALSRTDLESALGAEVAVRARAIALDPEGRPRVWAVVP